MSRCAYCRGFIWPWQRRGWLYIGARRSWRHFACWVAEDAAMFVLNAWDASLRLPNGRCQMCNGRGDDPLGWRDHHRNCPIVATARSVPTVEDLAVAS